MIVTVEEAKTKWCPMVRYTVVPGADVFNNREELSVDNNCIADRCMAWKWFNSFEKEQRGRGYCGLAGEG